VPFQRTFSRRAKQIGPRGLPGRRRRLFSQVPAAQPYTPTPRRGTAWSTKATSTCTPASRRVAWRRQPKNHWPLGKGRQTPVTCERWEVTAATPSPLRDLAASLGYQPDSDDTDALEAMVAPGEDGPIFSDDLPAHPRELPRDPLL
jgi:hypothetical protein